MPFKSDVRIPSKDEISHQKTHEQRIMALEIIVNYIRFIECAENTLPGF